MTGISYPRSGGSSGASVSALRSLHERLRRGDGDAATTAALAIEQLRGLIGLLSDSDLVAHACDTRDAILVAKEISGTALGEWQQAAMTICADHWVKVYPFEQTAFQGMAESLATQYDTAHPDARKDYQEKAGSLATFYQMSALLGQDLSAVLRSNTQQLGTSNFRGAHDAAGRLMLLECAGAYSVNVFVRVSVPGVHEPLVVVGEAKGGTSAYGEVKGPSTFMPNAAAPSHGKALFPISQMDIRYPVTRAYYMVKDMKKDPEHVARREAGRAIKRAYAENRLVFVCARGTITPTGITQRREHVECN